MLASLPLKIHMPPGPNRKDFTAGIWEFVSGAKRPEDIPRRLPSRGPVAVPMGRVAERREPEGKSASIVQWDPISPAVAALHRILPHTKQLRQPLALFPQSSNFLLRKSST